MGSSAIIAKQLGDIEYQLRALNDNIRGLRENLRRDVKARWTMEDTSQVPSQMFDYKEIENYIYSSKIKDFERIEKELLTRKFLNNKGAWSEDKKMLCAFIHLLYNRGYLRKKLPGKEEKTSLLAYRRYLEKRYYTNIKKQFQNNLFPHGSENNYLVDFRFIFPEQDVEE